MTMRLRSPDDRLLAPVYLPSLLMAVSQEALTILLLVSLFGDQPCCSAA